MPLSEHEQQALEAMEQALYEQDPAFAHRVRSENTSRHRPGRLTLSVFSFMVGLALMLAFCFTTAVVVGVAGFLIMFVSLGTFWTSPGRMGKVRLDLTRWGQKTRPANET
jgi:Protein of unknown function (DUF3040)